MADEPWEEALLALEHKGWDSLCDRTGDSFYGRTMTDDAVMVLSGPRTERRTSQPSAV